MKFHDFSPFYRSGEGIRSKVSGDRLIDNPAVADAQGGSAASYSFDGTDDVVTGPTSTLYDNAFASGGTISAWVNPSSLGENVTGRIAQKGDQGGANGGWLLCCLAQSGNNISLRFQHLWSTGDVYADSGYSLPIGQWTHVAVHYDGSSPSNTATFYFNGVADVGTNTNSGSGTVATDDSTPLYIGDRSTSDKSWDGQISQVRIHNRALSADEVRASYNGQAVPYEYTTGKHLYTSDFSSGVDGWLATNGAVAGNIDGIGGQDNNLRFTLSGGSTGHYSNKDLASSYGWAYTDPHRIRVTFDIYIPSGQDVDGFGIWRGGQWVDDDGTANADYSSSGLGIGCDTDTWIPVSFESESNGSISIYPFDGGNYNTLDADGDLFYIRNYTASTIGCVAEYLPSGINATQWVDTSGNGLHGTTSTATAVNHTTGTLTLESGANLKMQDGGGIDFTNYTDGSVAGTSGLEVLKDYEEGTWTPTLYHGSTQITSLTYETGKYVKIGKLVYLSAYVQKTGSSATTGIWSIQGLPYNLAYGEAAAYPSAHTGYLTINGTNYGFTSSHRFQANDTDVLYLYGEQATTVWTTGIMYMSFTGVYEVA